MRAVIVAAVLTAFTPQRPAGTLPLDPRECRDGWRHWIRADGTLPPNLSARITYARTQHQ